MNKEMLAGAAMLALSLILTGCGGSEEPTTASEEPEETEATTETTEATEPTETTTTATEGEGGISEPSAPPAMLPEASGEAPPAQIPIPNNCHTAGSGCEDIEQEVEKAYRQSQGMPEPPPREPSPWVQGQIDWMNMTPEEKAAEREANLAKRAAGEPVVP